MNDIVFIEHNMGCDPIYDLFMSGTLLPETYELLEMAKSRGGYIAGGFAALVGYMCVIKRCTPDELTTAVAYHLGNGMLVWPAHNKFKNVNHGDIDIWFPDQASLDLYTGAVSHRGLTGVGVTSTVTGTATEYCIREKQRVQVITSYLMPMHEQLARFDIFNAMACISDSTLIVPEGWSELEESRTLHVASWKSPWTVSRIFKYMRKKGYQHLTPETSSHVVSEALAACAYVHAHPELDITKRDITMNAFRSAYKRGTLPWYLKQLFSSFTDEQLVLLSFLCHDPSGYNSSIHEVIRRHSE
jgi:hypothetical protein